MEKIKQNPFVKKVGFNRIVLCFVLILMYGLFCVLTQGKFAGMQRILSALNYAYFLGFLSLGVTFVIATGGSTSRSDRLCSAVRLFQVTA